MALGNSSSMGQARGKNKGTVARRSKEHYDARNYYSIAGSAVMGSDACREATNITYYHNGSSAVPNVNDIMYTSKRARNPNTFTAGHMKITDGLAANFNIQVDSAGVITRRDLCSK
tara:strand:- start:1478 stop:1825 length:348 start_codon:yes stop_codon:yes gene_type:complete